MKALAFLLFVVALPVFAVMPDEFKPEKLKSVEEGRRVFDLSPLIARSKKEGKPLFVYVSSSDCGYCRGYENYIRREKPAMTEVFAPYILVTFEVRHMKERPEFLVDGKRYDHRAFMALVGDANSFFTYPYFWSLAPSDGVIRQTHQLPRGSAHYTNVENHARLLQIPREVAAAGQ